LRTLRCRYHQFTYVSVNDPARGYATFIENMLQTANQAADEQTKKDAS